MAGTTLPPGAVGAPARRSPVAWVGVAAVLGAALFLVFGQALSYGFSLIDDPAYVRDNPMVAQGLTWTTFRWALQTFDVSNWHPLTWWSWMADVSLFGLAPGPMHGVNILLHGATALALWRVADRLLQQPWVAAGVALAFAVHPLRVESVVWIAERKDLLSGLFFLWAVLRHLDYAASGKTRDYALVAVAMALSLLAKPMAVTLPALLLVLDYGALGRLAAGPLPGVLGRLPRWLALAVEKLPLLAMAIASAVVTILAQQDALGYGHRLGLAERVLNAAAAYTAYLHDSVVPTRLAPLYPLAEQSLSLGTLGCLCLLAGLTLGAVALRRRLPLVLVGWLWFLGTAVPVIGLVQAGMQSHADRYTYLPQMGLALAAGTLLVALWRLRARWAVLALGLALVYYGGLARLQVGYWANDFLLYSRSLSLGYDSAVSSMIVAQGWLARGNAGEAETLVRHAVELEPGNPWTHKTLGAVLYAGGRDDEALAAFQEALRLGPNDPQTLLGTATVLERMGRADEAAALRAKATRRAQ